MGHTLMLVNFERSFLSYQTFITLGLEAWTWSNFTQQTLRYHRFTPQNSNLGSSAKVEETTSISRRSKVSKVCVPTFVRNTKYSCCRVPISLSRGLLLSDHHSETLAHKCERLRSKIIMTRHIDSLSRVSTDWWCMYHIMFCIVCTQPWSQAVKPTLNGQNMLVLPLVEGLVQ